MPVERIVSEWRVSATSRQSLRLAVLQKWGEEKHGTAEKYERYRYNVERLSDGTWIHLHRPAWKNKGCDFEVRCETAIIRADGKKQGRPSHDDLIAELIAVCNAHAQHKEAVLKSVERVWHCEEVNAICDELLPQLSTDEWRFRAERALKIAKWLFIEQDITDWNTSGRAMLMHGLRTALT
jgi:hypothetical protein